MSLKPERKFIHGEMSLNMDECEMSSVFEDFTDVPICPSVFFFHLEVDWSL